MLNTWYTLGLTSPGILLDFSHVLCIQCMLGTGFPDALQKKETTPLLTTLLSCGASVILGPSPKEKRYQSLNNQGDKYLMKSYPESKDS